MSTEIEEFDIKLNSLISTTKTQRNDLAKWIIEEVTNGNQDALKTFIYAAKAEEFFKELINNIRPLIASKQIQKGGLTLYESQIIERKNPDKYDFASSNDSTWNELNALLIQTKEKLKERETFLMALTEDVSTMEGEIIHPPQKTYGAQNISIKLL
jgi:hypothetical protein